MMLELLYYVICTEYTVINISGSLNAEVLSPSGKLKVNIRKPETDQIEVAFTAKEEGKYAFLFIFIYFRFSQLLDLFCLGIHL